MTWSDLEPYPSPGGSSRLGGVMMSASKQSDRFRPVTMIVFRPRLWEGPVPEWLKKGGMVAVRIGGAEDRGKLRIVKGTRFPIGGIAKDTGAIRVMIPLLPGQKPGKQKSIACEFDWNDGWIEIELPSWAKPGAAVPQPALSPEAARKWTAERKGEAA